MGSISQEDRTIHRRVTSSMVDLVLAEMDPGYTHHRERCPDGQFWVSIEGTQVVTCPRGYRRQNPLELMYYSPREPAVRLTSDRTLAYGIRLRLSTLRPHERDESWVQGKHIDWQTKRGVLQLIHHGFLGNQDGHELDEKVATLIAPLEVVKDESTSTRWMIQVEELLQVDPTKSLTDLSSEIGLAPAYVSSQFSRIHGISISRRRRQIMLDRALQGASGETLNESAIEAGFYDASHFHRTCMSELGVKLSDLRTLLHPRSLLTKNR